MSKTPRTSSRYVNGLNKILSNFNDKGKSTLTLKYKEVIVVEHWYDGKFRVFADSAYMFWSTDRETAEHIAEVFRGNAKSVVF